MAMPKGALHKVGPANLLKTWLYRQSRVIPGLFVTRSELEKIFRSSATTYSRSLAHGAGDFAPTDALQCRERWRGSPATSRTKATTPSQASGMGIAQPSSRKYEKVDQVRIDRLMNLIG